MTTRDHGGGLDAAIAQYGGTRADWLDLSTGINPVAYEWSPPSSDAWRHLPDQGALKSLTNAARTFWNVPDGAEIIPASGASALIAQIPGMIPAKSVNIPHPTYNEHGHAFDTWGWTRSETADTQVLVNPNNPDGRFWSASDMRDGLTIIDESFCDVAPDKSLIDLAARPNVIMLKSFGKFWGLAGLRLGFAICLPELAQCLRDRIGPWAVSGPALAIGAQALDDDDWAAETRNRLARDVKKLDHILSAASLRIVGGTDLFRLTEARCARTLQERLARDRILVRTFPYSTTLVRFGLPGADTDWDRIKVALT